MDKCCRNIHATIARERFEIARLARQAAHHHARGHSTNGLQAQIAAQKAQLANTLAILEDHEAAHAGEPVAV